MLIFLQGPLLGIIAAVLWSLNTVFWFCLFFIVAVFKLILPIKSVRNVSRRTLAAIASYWMYINTSMINRFIGIQWEVNSNIKLDRQQWYLIIANHQSWTDIVALCQVFNTKVPLFKFFLKKELIYVPFLGFTWWALEYPFIHRYSKKELTKKPYLREKNLETTMEACEKSKQVPSTIMNFIEGTRFTQFKCQLQNSPYQYLLKPKAGGIAYTLQAMREKITTILDVTIIYPNRYKSFWDLLCGRIRKVKIYVRGLKVTADLLGDYQHDKQFRIYFQNYLNKIWADKDRLIEETLKYSG